MFKIAIGQINVIPGQPGRNFETIKEYVTKAKTQGVDLIAFPELCLSGYLLGDQFMDSYWIKDLFAYNEKVKELSDGITIVWGNIWAGTLGKLSIGHDGRLLKLNAAFIAQNKQYVNRANGFASGFYAKHLLPNYRFFDDSRHFVSARDAEVGAGVPTGSFLEPFKLTIKGKTYSIGLEVCEDMWDESYQIPVTELYNKANVDVIINISASPWTLGKEKARQRRILQRTTLPFVFVNQVGCQNNGKNVLVFDGGSSIYNKAALIASASEEAKQELLINDFSTPHISPIPENKLYSMVIEGMRLFDSQVLGSRFKWIVGLSGGIDSAVSTALAKTAFGKKRVITYSLPTVYNSKTTKTNAINVAKALGIEFHELPITDVVSSFNSTLEKEKKPLTTEVIENVQARVRGSLLMNLAQVHNGVVLNNGNKIEIAVGYSTLYGDSVGALSPLGDLNKLQIAELALHINKINNKEIIPANLIPIDKNGVPFFELMPTAELKNNQIDPMKWGYHDWLINELLSFPSLAVESIMEKYLNNLLPENVKVLLKHYGLDKGSAFISDLEWVLRQWRVGLYKRIQLPPLIVVSRGAFGYDYRESQTVFESTSRYLELRKLILEKK